MTEEEIRNHMRYVEESVQVGNTSRLMGIGIEMLIRLVAAQEAIVHFANLDIEAQIEAAIESRSEVKAAEIVEEKSRRSFIGKKA